jgi:hypothetical protein
MVAPMNDSEVEKRAGERGILGRGRGNVGNGGESTGRRGMRLPVVWPRHTYSLVVIPREIRLFVNEVIENGRERSGDAKIVGQVPSRVRTDKPHISAVHGSGR